jgi:hypothetical protein
MTGPLRGAQHLVYEALAAAAIADAPDLMRKSSSRLFTGAVLGVSEMGSAEVRPEKSHLSLASGTRADRRTRTGPSHVNGLAVVRRRPFILPSLAGW